MNEQVLAHLRAQQQRHVQDLQDFIKIPAVASQNRGVHECAVWLSDFMQRAGVTPMVVEEANFPVLLAEVPGESERSVLIYGHYDVQPADEPDWRYPPFGGQVVEGRLYGRGTVDDKGPVMATLEAVRAYLDCGLRPPVTVKFLIEGEEEVGSPSLPPVLERYHDFLYCDALLNFDDNVWFDGRPRVIGGLKGSVKIRLEARLNREYHAMNSPVLEGAVWRLVWALNSLMGPDGRIRIRDFYDDVVPPQAEDIAMLADLNWNGEEILRESGARAFLGNKNGLEALTALILEPTCNLGGITGGYVAPERKGVVPAFAAAEMRFGLVPNQTAEAVYQKVCQHLAAEGFDDIDVQVGGGSNPWARTPMKGDVVQALARSLEKAFGRRIAYQPSYAGSGPEGVFQELFPKMMHAYSGFGPVDDHLHAPNEYIVVDDYLKGIEAVARFFGEYAGG
ncbi:MAG: M20/M25/M40 family metallo-hydrolase [Chloroflexi bacterium]|nr:M20/M25/M40 family metallo-hydrolase [Chloroflexota bacterium]